MGVIGAVAGSFPGSLGSLIGDVGVVFPSSASSHHWKGRRVMGHKKPDRKNQLGIRDTLPGGRQKVQPPKTVKPRNPSATVN